MPDYTNECSHVTRVPDTVAVRSRTMQEVRAQLTGSDVAANAPLIIMNAHTSLTGMFTRLEPWPSLQLLALSPALLMRVAC